MHYQIPGIFRRTQSPSTCSGLKEESQGALLCLGGQKCFRVLRVLRNKEGNQERIKGLGVADTASCYSDIKYCKS